MHTFIFDIGKTNIKAAVLDARGDLLWSRTTPNTAFQGVDYLQFNVDSIWDWLQESLREAACRFVIKAINTSTHGACAVLLAGDGNLAFPVMDYEFSGLQVEAEDYEALRPPFEETFSPALAFGLNLGRQLWWLQAAFPERFQRVASILMYPQYWAWKLTGHQVTEVTSLGCHTDLWEPFNARYSSLAEKLGLAGLFPRRVSAMEPVGNVSPALAQSLGLPLDCLVYPGVHDSNASFARHLYAGKKTLFTAISSGTWIVSMSSRCRPDSLVETRDMLTNVSVGNEPIGCARFMGGREFDEICRQALATTASSALDIGEEDLVAVIDAGIYAIPPFQVGSGPFACKREVGRIAGGEGSPALATLYLALMMDLELELLGGDGSIIFGGLSRKNPLLCRLLAQLRPHQEFVACDESAGSVTGAWCLTRWDDPVPEAMTHYEVIRPLNLPGLLAYREKWRRLSES